MSDFPTEMTAIWSCSKDDCNGWMRDAYSFEEEPTCSRCSSPMVRGMKSLPILSESRYDAKK